MEDGIEHLLQVDDPVERRLALKSKAVEPYHLRVALQDEDPEVRLAAAKHPGLTPELIQEILCGDDKWLAEQVLLRPDLRPEELEHALKDPELKGVAAQHPALSEEQRNALIEDPETPDAAKEIAHQGLIKNIGVLTYPQLGEGRAYSMPMIIDHRDLHDDPTRGSTMYNAKRVDPMKPNEAKLKAWAGGESPKEAHAQEGHEAQHIMFAKIKQRFGREAGYRIIANTLAGLDHEHRTHVFNLLDAHTPSHAYDPIRRPEEAITYLQNYLMDPTHRRAVHVNMRISQNINAMRASVQKARRAWNMLRARAEALRPEEVGVKVQKDEEVIGTWVEKLKKSQNTHDPKVADHVGMDMNLQTYLQAAKFLTGKELEPGLVRRHLIEQDDDMKEAVIAAAGLTGKEERKAFDAILELSELNKSEDKPTVAHDIQAVLPDDEDVAKSLRWAFQHSEVKTVKLGGKHSKGTMMAKDHDGQLMLIKPGSGKVSPIAGAREEKASQSRREAAFYSVAKSWGFNKTIPRASLIIIDGKEVAVMEMLPLDWQGLHKTKKEDPSLPQKALRDYLDRGIVHKWAVLDYVLGNGDRHGMNLMVSPADENHKLALIDHGSAFAGPSFDPGQDKSSFVPYYLRAWGPEKGFMKLSNKQKLDTMPILHEAKDIELRDWITGLSEPELEARLHRFGINPAACVARLNALKNAVAHAKNASRVINEFWIK